MKKCFLLAAMMMSVLTVIAVPAKRVWRTMTQADGTQIELMLVGDENFHFFTTRDEVPVIEEDGAYFYAKPQGFAIASTGVLAHESELRTDEEKMHLSTIEDLLTVKPYSLRRGPKRMRRVGEEEHPSYMGNKKGLIILANFSDKKFYDYSEEDNGSTTWQRYDALANEEGYTNNYGAIGSVHDYYHDQSYGKLNLTFDVVGPVNLPKSYSYYGAGDDYKAPEMIVDCCEMVDSLVNFKDYDWDGDGVVEEVFVLYAGYGEATGGSKSTIWPHMWTLEAAAAYSQAISFPFMLDDAVINVYACSNELYSNSGKTQMGLGVICHEFSHCLGLPDLYDTSYYGNFGMDAWDILDSGSYNGPMGLGWVPAGYSTYERWYAGWMKPSEMKTSRRIRNQKPLNEKGQAYIIYNDNYPDEYYILENRNRTGWDSYLPGDGLLIFHVDYDADEWYYNSVNTTSFTGDHERLTVFHASNSNYGGNEAYPYAGNDSLTDTSVPAAKLWHANIDGTKLMHKPITEITRDPETAKVSFLFRNLNTPSAVDEIPFMESGAVCVYRLDGTKVAEFNGKEEVHGLLPGTYIIKEEERSSYKIQVR